MPVEHDKLLVIPAPPRQGFILCSCGLAAEGAFDVLPFSSRPHSEAGDSNVKVYFLPFSVLALTDVRPSTMPNVQTNHIAG